MAKKLRVGFIGVGGIAGAHLSAYEKMSDVEIVALCDIKAETLQRRGETLGVAPEFRFTDYRKMLDKVELDIVDVCTANTSHAKPVIAALQAGRNVIVEKPAGISAREVEQMIQAGKEAKKLLMVGQTLRFGTDGQICRKWVDQGALGEVYWGRAEFCRVRGVPGSPSFYDQKIAGGGPCYDLAVHVLDMALWLMNHPEPVAVSAGTYLKIANKPSLMGHDPRKYTVPEDFAVALVRFQDGRTLSVGASFALNLPQEMTGVTLCGTKGGLTLWPPVLVTESDGIVANVTPQVTAYGGADSFYNELSALVQAVRTDGPSPVPGEQALITQRILDAIYLSGAKGREVKV